MKRLYLLIFCILSVTILEAQYGYTYISDRRFYRVEDLVGYDFRPSKKEIPNVSEEDLNPGEYSFGISFNNLFVEGEGVRGVYNINNISPTEYGYKLLLINARDARLQGHLKVIMNKYNMVEALIFKRSPKEEETIYYLEPISKKLNERERNYFTDRGEMIIEKTDSLWGKTIYPFIRIHLDRNVQEPLDLGDSTSISFVREIVVELKEKEKKKKGKKGKEEVAEEEVEQVEIDSMQVDSLSDRPAPYEPPLGVVLYELDEKYVDKSKYKITKEYFVVVRSILQYEDGMKEDKTWKYPIKKVVEREDELAKMHEERFQVEFTSPKAEGIYLYLTGDKTVSTFEVENQMFLMRGF